MAFRKLLLRVMLWSLALAAAGGVLAVLFSGHETAWRVVGTMVTTAVAAGLMMWMSVLSERPRTREAGFLGMCVVVAEWILAEALIWDIRWAVGLGYQFEEAVGMSMLFGAGTAIWTMLALTWRRRKGFERAAITGLAVAMIVALLWLLGAWWPQDSGRYYVFTSSIHDKLLESSWAAACMGVLLTVLMLDIIRLRWWVLIAMVCDGVALALWMTAICMDIHESNGTAECIASVAVVGAFCNALRLVRLRDAQQWVVLATMAVAIATGVMVDVVIVLDKQHGDVDLLGRLAAAGGILTGCGTMAMVVLGRLNRHDIVPSEMPTVTDVAIICPVCAKKQKLQIGDSKCSGCGLLFEIKVKEPRCPQCNYLLFMLKSDRCPECGRALEMK